MDETEEDGSSVGIQDLPEETLEYILSLLSPYGDFQAARLVCRRWHKVMQVVVKQASQTFIQMVSDGTISWSSLEPQFGRMISERYSHSSCYHNKAVYIFGGCTSTGTTFNDLWRFDLMTRRWARPLTMGAYPAPKACASLVSYKDILVLFGGWRHPTPLPFHQLNNFFNDVYIYSVKTNIWSVPEEPVSRTGVITSPSGRAGHGATVVGDKMVVFGGSRAHGTGCDDVWVLDLETMEWEAKAVQGTKPRARFGHSQVLLDPHNLLIIGGCAGPNMQFNDVWLLKMGLGEWCWRKVKVSNPENSPPKLWCHPACKVGNQVIVLSKLSSWSPRVAALASREAQQAQKLCMTKTDSSSSSPSTSRHKNLQSDNLRLKSKRPLPETSESSSQESSSDGEDRSMAARKYFGSSYSASRMTAQLSATLRVNHRDPEGAANGLDARTGAAAAAGGSVQQQQQPVAGPSHEYRGANVNDRVEVNNPHTLPVREGMPSIRPNAMKNRQKQLEALRRHEERIRFKLNNPAPQPPGGGLFHNNPIMSATRRQQQQAAAADRSMFQPQRPMFIHALNASDAISEEEVQWQDVGIDYEGIPPEEKIFYSLVPARGELVIFGGIDADVNTMQRGIHGRCQSASNMTHFIKSKPKLR